ncbi:MAG: ATP-binding protein, partial [Solirubrobacteraceae bacterium]|nr:ATP-binding protein [Solirubrobacteraceae bacterium]
MFTRTRDQSFATQPPVPGELSGARAMNTSGPRGVAGDADGWPLLERDGDVGALTEVVAGAGEGRGGFVLVRAPAGVGKTRLLGTAVDL